MKVRLHGNWCSDSALLEDFNTMTPGGRRRWKDMELTLGDDYDRIVVFNYPTVELRDPSKAVLFDCEPLPTRRANLARYHDRVRGIPVKFDTERHFNFARWYVRRSYDDLLPHPQKNRQISAVVSGLNLKWLPRHRIRLDFVVNHLVKMPGVDHYGRDVPRHGAYRGELADKADGLLPYRYTFAAENFLECNYFTEKVLDGILCECLTFYDGCPNLEAFLDPETFIRVDAADPAGALEIIKDAVARNEWERRLPAIRAQKKRLMTDLHPLEIIRKAVAREQISWRATVEFDGRAPVRPQRSDLAQAYVISLEGSPRRSRISAHLERLGIPFEFLDAVDGRRLDGSEFDALVVDDAASARLGRTLTRPEAAATLSHASVFERMERDRVEVAVVFEDDVRLTDDAAAVIAGVTKAARPGELVLLGATGAMPLRIGRQDVVAPGRVVQPVSRAGVWCAFAYVVTREAARRLQKELIPVRSVPDDWALYSRGISLRILQPECAWAPGPYLESSYLAGGRDDAVAESTGTVSHDMLARLSYKMRVVEVLHPRLRALTRVVDSVEFGRYELPLATRRLLGFATGRDREHAPDTA